MDKDRPIDESLGIFKEDPDEGDSLGKPFGDTFATIRGKSSHELLLGAAAGWLAGYSFIKIGKIAAFGLGARPIPPMPTVSSLPPLQMSVFQPPDPGGLSDKPVMLPERPVILPERPIMLPERPVMLPEHTGVLPEKPPAPDPTYKSSEPFKAEDPNLFLEKPFIPPKPVSHSPKISPSSIPNPSPSVTTTKQMESSYTGYGGYKYSIPGYSAFQPISYPGIMQPSQGPIQAESSSAEYMPFPLRPKENKEEKNTEVRANEGQPKFDVPNHDFTKIQSPKLDVPQTDADKVLPFDVPKPSVQHFEVPKPIMTQTEEKIQNLQKPDLLVSNLTKNEIPKIDTQTNDVLKPDIAKFDKPNAEVSKLEASTNNVLSFDKRNHDIPKYDVPMHDVPKFDIPKPDVPKFDPPTQTDFEEQFTPEIIPTVPITDANKPLIVSNESQMNITSMAQGSGATVTISPQISNKDAKKKTSERFSLKTSIPISKIDMKCVSNQNEGATQSPVAKKLANTCNSTFFTPMIEQTQPEVKVQSQMTEKPTKVEIQSNVVIKKASIENDHKSPVQSKLIPVSTSNNSTGSSNNMNNSINALLNAAEAISKSESLFKKPEPKQDNNIHEIKDPPPPNFTQPIQTSRAIFNPVNFEPGKMSFVAKQQETAFAEQKNPILLIQNKNNMPNSKMLLAIQQQNPQVLLQRTNFDPKNLQAPSRLSSQSKRSNEENGITSKVVALKRLHQENCDMNDFENLITENQIYGNKIVVKEKSQGTQQEQDLKNKNRTERPAHIEAKNVVLQPNFLYLSNVQLPLPANCMMIKNNTRINQTPEMTKMHTITINPTTSNESKTTTETGTMTSVNDVRAKNAQQTVSVSKEIHVFKPNNNIVIGNNNKTDVVYQTHQKVIMNPQILYKVPMIVDKDKKVNQTFVNHGENSKFTTQGKPMEQNNTKEKLYIACVDSKSQPKIIITNIRDQMHKIEEVSALDMYERRKRLKRLKYLSNKETCNSNSSKPEITSKKIPERVVEHRSIVTPDKIQDEVLKEFEKSQAPVDGESSESDSEYDNDEELQEYSNIIEKYSFPKENNGRKAEFLANFRLATQEVYKDKELDRQERILKRDKVASAYIAAGRLDIISNDETNSQDFPDPRDLVNDDEADNTGTIELEKDNEVLQQKQIFLNSLSLSAVTPRYREGYERIWQEIIKERKRRNIFSEPGNVLKKSKNVNIDLDTNNQLKILTEIKKSVTDNTNLIKMRLDSTEENLKEADSIKTLAEKSFSELNRVTKMADRSVKIITGQDTRKRDLTPGFDSENIQKQSLKIQQPFQNYPQIKIPNISKIISLKTDYAIEETLRSDVTSTQAISMDEPQNSAAGASEITDGKGRPDKVRDFGCQVEDFSCLGIDEMIRKYREYDAARKKEISYLHRRNTALRVSLAKTNRSTGHHTELARALLAERNALAAEELREINQIQKLWGAIRTVLNCQVETKRNKSYRF